MRWPLSSQRAGHGISRVPMFNEPFTLVAAVLDPAQINARTVAP